MIGNLHIIYHNCCYGYKIIKNIICNIYIILNFDNKNIIYIIK